MSEVQRRAPRVQPVSPAVNTADTSWMTRGASGVDRNRQVQVEQQERRNTPRTRDFSCKKNETREIIILDRTFDEIVFVWEHLIPGEGNNFKQAKNVLCPREFANCAVCERAESGGKGSRFRMPYYCMKVSVLDISGYTDKTTNEHVDKAFRMMMTVKSEQINDFDKMFQVAMREHGTIRGMYINMARDGGDTSPRIGKPSIQDNGRLFQMYDEATLVREFGHEAVLKEGSSEVLMPANGYLQPYEYGKVLPRPDPDAIRRVWGGGPAAGSAAANEEAWDEGTDDGQSAADHVGDDADETHSTVQRAAPSRERTRPGAAAAPQRGVDPNPTPPVAPAVRTRLRPGAPPAAPAASATPSRPAQGGTRAGVVRRGSVAQGDDIPF
jgi:hypothetical protein